MLFFFFSSRRRHTRFDCDWSSDVCSSDLGLSSHGGRHGARRRICGGTGSASPVSAPTNAVVQEQSGFVVELEQFSGPLDLLLHLITEDELDITDLPIARIADQFLAVINELRLNQAADYLEMAARLLRIKA